MKNSSKNHCRVCGLYQETPPWGEDQQNPTYEICSCCGVEFGNEDLTQSGVIQYRNEWIGNGAKWFEGSTKPENWDLKKQLKSIPKLFRA